MKHFIPIIILTLGTSLFTTCSPPPEVHPLSIGDQIPAISATISINGTSNRESLTDSREKLIILEFINTWCSVCLQSVPHLEKLQKQFPNDLSIILVTQQKDSLVQAVANTHKWSLPVITGDTTLSNLFPYLVVPHQVWIKDKEILAITDWQYANKKNISSVLAGEPVKLHHKSEDTLTLDKPLLKGTPPALYQSAITPPLNYGAGTRRKDNQLLIYNADIPKLYLYAFNKPTFPFGAYIKAEVNDSTRQLIQSPTDQLTGNFSKDSTLISWKEKYTFCYNLVFPSNFKMAESEWHEIMQEDLNQFFSKYIGITGSVEKRKTDCLTLVDTDSLKRFISKGGTPFRAKSANSFDVLNKPIEILIKQVAYRNYQLGIPVINATGYSGNIDLHIPSDLTDLNEVNLHLLKYGLQFIRQPYPVDMVVLKSSTKKTRSQHYEH